MQKLRETSKALSIALLCFAIVSCATASVCPSKTEKQIEAEKRADSYERLATSYRIRNDEEQAKYHEEKAREEQWKATGESDWFTAIILTIFGATCDHQ